jgi:hypothetical protein
MKRLMILAAAAAIAGGSFATAAFAKPADFSTDDATICQLLEAAHESTCAEFELAQEAPQSLVDTETVTGSTSPAPTPVDM